MIATGGPRNSAPGTLNQLFLDAVAQYRKPDALQVKRRGAWEPISHDTLAQRVRRVAFGLEELGVKHGERVAILSENRPEWAIADYACLTSGVTDVPIYPNLPADQIAYILRDSGAVAIFVSDAAQAAKIASVRGQCPALHLVITFTPGAAGADVSIEDVEARGTPHDTPQRQTSYRERALSVKPDDLATLIYTSGTTGEPKGVMLSHDNIFSNVAAARVAIPFSGHDVGLSFLPLSHILERMAGHYLFMATGTSIAYGSLRPCGGRRATRHRHRGRHPARCRPRRARDPPRRAQKLIDPRSRAERDGRRSRRHPKRHPGSSERAL